MNCDAGHKQESDIVFIVIIYCNRTTTIRHFFLCVCVFVVMTRLSPWEIFKVCTVFFICQACGQKAAICQSCLSAAFSPRLGHPNCRSIEACMCAGVHAQSLTHHLRHSMRK